MGLYDAAKDAAKILKEAGKIEEYQKILDLIDDLFDKRDKIDKLETENKELKEKLKVVGDYEFKINAYYNKESGDGPYCSRCFDKNKDLIRIIPDWINGNYATCPECKQQVNFTGRENSASFL
jgi:DNA repair exonuclease SbcCD ATPase subunit